MRLSPVTPTAFQIKKPAITFGNKLNSGLMSGWDELEKTNFADVPALLMKDRRTSLNLAAGYILQTLGIEPQMGMRVALQVRDIPKTDWLQKLNLLKRLKIRQETFTQLEMPVGSYIDDIKSGKKQGTIRLGIRTPGVYTNENLKIVPVKNGVPKGRAFHVAYYDTKTFPFMAINESHLQAQGGGTVEELKSNLNGFYGHYFPNGEIPPEYPMTEIQFRKKQK